MRSRDRGGGELREIKKKSAAFLLLTSQELI